MGIAKSWPLWIGGPRPQLECTIVCLNTSITMGRGIYIQRMFHVSNWEGTSRRITNSRFKSKWQIEVTTHLMIKVWLEIALMSKA